MKRCSASHSTAAAAAAKSLQSCPTLCGPIDGSPPGSPFPGILQARTLEWVAISFSSAWKWKVKVKSLSRVRLLATPWTAAHQAPLSTGFSRQEDWSGMPLPSLSQSTREIQIKTTVRYHLKPIRKAIIKKSTNNKCWKDCEEKGNTVDENVNWYSHHGEQYGGSLKKQKIELPYDPPIQFLGMYLEKTIIQKDTCTLMFIAALFTIGKTRKQLKCSSTDEWIQKKCYIYTMKYCMCVCSVTQSCPTLIDTIFIIDIGR